MGFTLDGASALLRDIERMMPSDNDVDDYLRSGGDVIAQEMRDKAPVGETGNLKAAIKVGSPRNRRTGRSITVGIHRRDIDLTAKDGAYYPAFVEYGHGGPHPAPPHPFIRPAYDLKKDDAWTAIKQAAIDDMKL